MNFFILFLSVIFLINIMSITFSIKNRRIRSDWLIVGTLFVNLLTVCMSIFNRDFFTSMLCYLGLYIYWIATAILIFFGNLYVMIKTQKSELPNDLAIMSFVFFLANSFFNLQLDCIVLITTLIALILLFSSFIIIKITYDDEKLQ